MEIGRPLSEIRKADLESLTATEAGRLLGSIEEKRGFFQGIVPSLGWGVAAGAAWYFGISANSEFPEGAGMVALAAPYAALVGAGVRAAVEPFYQLSLYRKANQVKEHIQTL